MKQPPLRDFFQPLTRRTFGELGLGEGEVADYLAEVLAVFARTERLYRLRDPAGQPLTTIVEMLGMGLEVESPAAERALHRHVGDFAIFMSGVFRPFIDRRGCLGLYLGEGARAYGRVAALSLGSSDPRTMLFAELSDRFETYSGALDYLRKVSFHGLAGPDPIRAFLREIESVLTGLSRN